MPTFAGDALYAHAKGGCYRCLRGDNLVDLDAQIIGEGALVLCKNCVLEAAEAAGLSLNAAAVAEQTAAIEAERRLFSPEAVQDLQDALDAVTSELEAERAVVDRLMGKGLIDAKAKSSSTEPA